MTGTVTLVGAGPGGKALLTLAGAEALQNAHAVVYDRLVSDEILALIPPAAEPLCVGKENRRHPVPQAEINALLVRLAQSGRNVVRLKGGDCFLFGRGGEECEFLKAHGIPFRVIPGVSSALAVPAFAGIPVTHRDFCSSLHIITAHAKKHAPLQIDYPSLAAMGGTLVFLMGVGALPELCAGLLAAGLQPSTPAAVIENGARARQRKCVSTLAALPARAREMALVSPAVIVVGEVCTLSSQLDWFTPLPLHGKTIAVTRPRERAGPLAARLRARGAEVLEIPCIQTVLREDLSALRRALDADRGADCGADRGASCGVDRGADCGAVRGADRDAVRSADRGADYGADRGADRGAACGADRGAACGAVRGADHGVDRGAVHSVDRGAACSAVRGADRGAACGADCGAACGADRGADCGADCGADHSVDRGAACGADCGAACGADRSADFGADRGADRGADCGADRGADCGADRGPACGADRGADRGWCAFTSPSGVEMAVRALLRTGRDLRALYGKKLAALGPGTAEALAAYGLRADLVPDTADGIHLAEALLQAQARHVLLLRGSLGGAELVRRLTAGGTEVLDVPVYDTLPGPAADSQPAALLRARLQQGTLDAAIFASASAVRGFAAAAGGGLEGLPAICIGAQCGQEAARCGMQVTLAESASADALIEALSGAFAAGSSDNNCGGIC